MDVSAEVLGQFVVGCVYGVCYLGQFLLHELNIGRVIDITFPGFGQQAW
jgi:hypothetical protein